MNPKQALTPEQVKEFFSATHEFKVEEKGHNLKISYTDDGETTSTLVWNNPQALTFQQLIRTIKQLVWNHCHEIFD